MNEIRSVTFTPSATTAAGGDVIEVQQALNDSDRVRRIEATVEQSIATTLDELDFYWCRTYANEQGRQVRDTLRTKGYLEVTLPVGQAMEYNIFLQIYDRSTDLSHYSSFRLATRPLFKNSLFVLHGQEASASWATSRSSVTKPRSTPTSSTSPTTTTTTRTPQASAIPPITTSPKIWLTSAPPAPSLSSATRAIPEATTPTA